MIYASWWLRTSSLKNGLFVSLLCSSAGCTSQQTIHIVSYAEGHKRQAEYVRHYNPRRKAPHWVGPPVSFYTLLRQTDTTKAALVLGHVALQLEDKTFVPQPGAIVMVNGSHTFTDNAGNYLRTISAGAHTLRVGAIGILWSEAPPLRVKPGDSIRVDFQLIPDFRPTMN